MEVVAKSYTLKNKNVSWLGLVVLTSDGAFMSITDYGNFSFAWRHTGCNDFRKFLLNIDVHYFAGKMFNGMSYICHNQQVSKASKLFSEMILPALKSVLKDELESEKDICYKTGEPCKHGCNGLCRENC